MTHRPDCGCVVLRDSPAAKNGIDRALREVRLGEDAGRVAARFLPLDASR